jgi:hypothetical protein
MARAWLSDQTDGDLSDKPPRPVPFAREPNVIPSARTESHVEGASYCTSRYLLTDIGGE